LAKLNGFLIHQPFFFYFHHVLYLLPTIKEAQEILPVTNFAKV